VSSAGERRKEKWRKGERRGEKRERRIVSFSYG
jgi:hypothetical protein